MKPIALTFFVLCTLALLVFAPFVLSCGDPPSCEDLCLDNCDEHPGKCEPSASLYCLQACAHGEEPGTSPP